MVTQQMKYDSCFHYTSKQSAPSELTFAVHMHLTEFLAKGKRVTPFANDSLHGKAEQTSSGQRCGLLNEDDSGDEEEMHTRMDVNVHGSICPASRVKGTFTIYDEDECDLYTADDCRGANSGSQAAAEAATATLVMDALDGGTEHSENQLQADSTSNRKTHNSRKKNATAVDMTLGRLPSQTTFAQRQEDTRP